MTSREAMPLSQIVSRISERNSERIERVLTVSAHHGLIEQERFFTKRVAAKNLSGYLVVRQGTFVYNKSYSAAAPFGVATYNKMTEPGVISPLYFTFRPNSDLVIDEYLEYVLNSSTFHQQMARYIKEGGRAHGGINISVSDYLSVEVPLPTPREQRRVVDLVSAVDSYIAALQQQADAARVARSAVLRELLSIGGEDRTQIAIRDMVGLSRERVDPRSIDPSTVLQHWSIPALDEVGGPIYESAAAIGSHKFRVRRTAVVYSLLNPRIPRYALIAGGEDVVCSTEFAVMYPKSIVLDTFLLVLVSSTLFQETVASSAKGTTKSRERVRPGDFDSISITLPPLVEQKRIVSIVSSIDEVIQSADRAVADAKNLRSGLLSDLLSGAHEIPESYDRLLGAA